MAAQQTFNHQPVTPETATPVLVGEDLLLRGLEADDAPSLARAANDPAIAEMTFSVPNPYSLQDAEAFITDVISGKRGGQVHAVTTAQSGTLVGVIELRRRAKGASTELAYWIGRPWWGQGFASKACSLVIDQAFRVSDIGQIIALTMPHNPAARAVLLKQGFRFAGLDERHGICRTKPVAVECFRLTCEDWIANMLTNSINNARS